MRRALIAILILSSCAFGQKLTSISGHIVSLDAGSGTVSISVVHHDKQVLDAKLSPGVVYETTNGVPLKPADFPAAEFVELLGTGDAKAFTVKQVRRYRQAPYPVRPK